VIQNSVRDGEVLVIMMPGKKGSGIPFWLPSKKELPEWHSNVFSHKNTPG
jgi:hypothetical protein